MATFRIGPGLAGFPAFPDPATVNPFTLSFDPQPDSLTFSLNGYRFRFTGDFAEAAAAFTQPSPIPGVPLFYLALSPLSPVQLPIRLDGVETIRLSDGAIVNGFSGASADLLLGSFFATLLDPRNYTDDIITAFFGSTAPFTTLDLTAFADTVVMGQPNAAVTGPDGERGVVAFAQELNGFAFTTVIGGAGDDRLGGTARAERFEGHDGDDVLLGREGGDTLLGGIGRDVLSGGAGDDSLGGGEDADVLAAGAGRNTLEGGGGADRFVIAAGPGHDRIEDFSAAQGDLLDLSAFGLSPQALKAVLAGAAATEEGLLLRIPAAGGPHSLLLAGLESLDAAQVMRVAGRAVEADAVVVSGPRDGLVAGGAADDTLLGRDGGQALDGRAGDDVILAGQGADRLAGGTGDDVLDGGGGNDTADGGADDDVVFGGAGDDRLTGGDGDDFLDGGEGDDRLEGGLGTNTLTGEAGRDIFAFARFKETADRVTDFADGVDLIDIRLLVKFQATAETLGSYLQVTSPGATELTRFLLVDRDGARGEFGFERVAQFDNVTDAMLLDPGNYLF